MASLKQPQASWSAIRLAQRFFFPAVFLVLAILPTAFLDRLPTLCIYRSLFGFRCLGCGMTHAFSSVVHGEWAAAWAYNHLVVIAFPLLAFIAIRDARYLLRQLYRTATARARLAHSAGLDHDAQNPHCVAFQPHQELYKPF